MKTNGVGASAMPASASRNFSAGGSGQPAMATVTPTSTGDVTLTLTVRTSVVASATVWLDGLYHYPMIQSVRHWGYQWLPQAAQITDTRVTLIEAAALVGNYY